MNLEVVWLAIELIARFVRVNTHRPGQAAQPRRKPAGASWEIRIFRPITEDPKSEGVLIPSNTGR